MNTVYEKYEVRNKETGCDIFVVEFQCGWYQPLKRVFRGGRVVISTAEGGNVSNKVVIT